MLIMSLLPSFTVAEEEPAAKEDLAGAASAGGWAAEVQCCICIFPAATAATSAATVA